MIAETRAVPRYIISHCRGLQYVHCYIQKKTKTKAKSVHSLALLEVKTMGLSEVTNALQSATMAAIILRLFCKITA